jgi:uncharacterized membrane protein YozB (DUF420 family)
VSDSLGGGAPVLADAVLVVELAFGLALLVGVLLIRRGQVRLHAYLQTSLVLVNLPIVLSWMVPSYLRNVLPGLPASLGEPFYLVPTLMLVVGSVAESLGVYVILVAGTNLLPERWRFRRYKLWMRTTLGLWWTVLLLGVTTYLVWYS